MTDELRERTELLPCCVRENTRPLCSTRTARHIAHADADQTWNRRASTPDVAREPDAHTQFRAAVGTLLCATTLPACALLEVVEGVCKDAERIFGATPLSADTREPDGSAVRERVVADLTTILESVAVGRLLTDSESAAIRTAIRLLSADTAPAADTPEVEHVQRALEQALADHGMALEPVDDAAEVAAALARYLARDGEGGWRPISTCPLHTTVLLYRLTDLHPVVGYRMAGDVWMLEENGPEDGEHRKFPIIPVDYAPTHWMPLPATPAEPRLATQQAIYDKLFDLASRCAEDGAVLVGDAWKLAGELAEPRPANRSDEGWPDGYVAEALPDVEDDAVSVTDIEIRRPPRIGERNVERAVPQEET